MKTHSIITSSALACMLVFPTFASAAQFEYLLDDLGLLENEIAVDEQVQIDLNAELEYESDDELFPRDQETDEIDESFTRDGIISDTHVYTRIDGIPVVLNDVAIVEWYAPYVRDMADKGIISGYRDAAGNPLGKFGPADNVTLQQLAKIAVYSAGVDQSKCPSDVFNPTAKGNWSEPFVACAEYLRWVVFTDPEVDLTRPATRSEVVSTILEAFERDFEVPTGEVFADVSNSLFLRAPIETAYLDGIVAGYKDENGEDTGFFGPFDPVNRAETAKIVSLAMQVYGY